MQKILTGNLLMIFCGIFYLLWWIIRFKPGTDAGRGVTGVLLFLAFAAGLSGIIVMNLGFREIPREYGFTDSSLILWGSVALYAVLFLLSLFLFRRRVTTELFLITGWMMLEFTVLNDAAGTEVLSGKLSVVLALSVGITGTASFVCYMLYYGLEEKKGYVDGMIPLVLSLAVMAAVTAAIFLNRNAFHRVIDTAYDSESNKDIAGDTAGVPGAAVLKASGLSADNPVDDFFNHLSLKTEGFSYTEPEFTGRDLLVSVRNGERYLAWREELKSARKFLGNKSKEDVTESDADAEKILLEIERKTASEAGWSKEETEKAAEKAGEENSYACYWPSDVPYSGKREMPSKEDQAAASAWKPAVIPGYRMEGTAVLSDSADILLETEYLREKTMALYEEASASDAEMFSDFDSGKYTADMKKCGAFPENE